MSILETISHRESIRTYNGESLKKQDMEKLQAFLDTGVEHRGEPIRFKMINTNVGKAERIKDLSAYGMIKGAKHYIIGIANEKTSLVDFGYAFEQIVLYAESLGIGTCWLGGTFKRKKVARLLKIRKDEWIPAMMAIGYAAKKPSARALLTRLTIKADMRKPFDEVFFSGKTGMPLTEATSGAYAEALESVRLAPSASNKQPWRLGVNTRGDVEFYIKRTPNYAQKLGYDIQLADIGIAMWHFEASAKELGILGEYRSLGPDNYELGIHDEQDYITTFVRA